MTNLLLIAGGIWVFGLIIVVAIAINEPIKNTHLGIGDEYRSRK